MRVLATLIYAISGQEVAWGKEFSELSIMFQFRTLLSHLLVVLFSVSVQSIRAQQMVDTIDVDFSSYKGSLICINEAHNVKTNEQVYLSVIHKMLKSCKHGDSINLVLEVPYSLVYLYNHDAVNTDTSTRVTDYLRSLICSVRDSKLPVRIVGYDVEYDEGRTIRRENYLRALRIMSQGLSRHGASVKTLDEYIGSLLRNGKWFKSERKEVLIREMEQELSRPHDASTLMEIRELLFVLSAEHTVHIDRDSSMFERLIQAERLGFVRYKANFNLLISGSAHISADSRTLYGLFLDKANSPFWGKTYLIAQGYFNCRHKDYYNSGNNNFMSGSIIPIELLEDEIRKMPQLLKGGVTAVRGIHLETLNQFRGRILYWYLHNEVY
ncbi:MAG: hypothetical protein JNL72_02255 [Flavipsychrobacter sp.]|nr:hypothetical protein [Flavipsychrobacter sp.]